MTTYQDLLEEFDRRRAHDIKAPWMDTDHNRFEFMIFDLQWAIRSVFEKLQNQREWDERNRRRSTSNSMEHRGGYPDPNWQTNFPGGSATVTGRTRKNILLKFFHFGG